MLVALKDPFAAQLIYDQGRPEVCDFILSSCAVFSTTALHTIPSEGDQNSVYAGSLLSKAFSCPNTQSRQSDIGTTRLEICYVALDRIGSWARKDLAVNPNAASEGEKRGRSWQRRGVTQTIRHFAALHRKYHRYDRCRNTDNTLSCNLTALSMQERILPIRTPYSPILCNRRRWGWAQSGHVDYFLDSFYHNPAWRYFEPPRAGQWGV